MWFYVHRLTLPVDSFREVKKHIHERISYAQEKKENPYFFFFERKKFYKGNEVDEKFYADFIEKWYQLLAEKTKEYRKRKLSRRIVAFSFTINPGIHIDVFTDRKERQKFVKSFFKTMRSYVKSFFSDYSGVLGIHRNTCYYHSHLFLNPVSLGNHKILAINREDIELHREFLLKRFERWINEFGKRKIVIEERKEIEEEILKEKINWGLEKYLEIYLREEENGNIAKQKSKLHIKEIEIEEIVGLKGVLRKRIK